MNKFLKGFTYAFNGIKQAFVTELNMKVHVVVAVLVLFAAIYFRVSANEWIAILLCFALVLSAEIANTAIETLVNLVSPQQNKQAGLVKDLAAGAVLVNALISAIIAGIIFIPKVMLLLQ